MPDDQRAAAGAPPKDGDEELNAINAVVAALKPLDDEQRSRVIEYVMGRFGPVHLPSLSTTLREESRSPATLGIPPGTAVQDIRTLKEAKNPRSANEMAALVAYYVSELAPMSERRGSITKSDIENYFKSGGFHLPADAGFTLVNAKNAGYLDAIGNAQYKLNPVGYNLVAHRMGTEKSGAETKGKKKKKKKKAKRKAVTR
jgi:hypothetical protein